VAEANRVSASDLQSEEWTAEVKKCLGMETTGTNENNTNPIGGDADDDDGGNNTGGGWTAADRDTWATQCSQSLAGQNWTEVAEKGYCDCVREKLEQKYASFAEMNAKGTYEDGVEFGKQCTDFLIKGGKKQ